MPHGVVPLLFSTWGGAVSHEGLVSFLNSFCAKRFHGVCLLAVIFRENIDLLSLFSVSLGCKVMYLRHVNQDCKMLCDMLCHTGWLLCYLPHGLFMEFYISEILCGIQCDYI